ncbi:DUF1592 domain-containing protein [Stieleria sp.]|uniref:DUF1592 domain-containing protein n=1 Tax=Stieleria sp. TaxID=2795976 RepID=UPI003569523C
MKPTHAVTLFAVSVFVLVAFWFPSAGTPGSMSYGDDAIEQVVVSSSGNETPQASFSETIAPILKRNCSQCHGEGKQEAGLRFDELDPAMSSDQDVSVWSSVRDALNAHQMPPPEETRQPSEQERQQIVTWIDASFERVAQRRRANRSSSMRRLTVAEYEHTLQELFGAKVPFATNLPAAPLSEYGYSRDADLLGVSALELEYFLAIARQSVDDYVIFAGHIPDSEHYLIEFEDVEYRPGVAGGYSVDEPLTEQELLEKRRARDVGPAIYSDRTLFPLPDGPLDLSSEELNRSDRQKFHQQFARFKSHQLHKAGELVARVYVAAKLGDDGSAPRLRFRIGDTLGMEFAEPIPGECDVTASPEKPQVCTFRIPFRHIPTGTTEDEEDEEGEETTLTLSVSNASHDPDAIFDVVPEGYNYAPGKSGLMSRYRKTLADSIVSKAAMRKAGVNELYLDAIEIDLVPFGLDMHARLWRIDAQRANLNAGADARTVAEESLQAFMQRAYRRSISPAELGSMMSLYDQFRSEGDSFEDALKETFSTVLISDPFLYVAAPIPLEQHQSISEEERRQLASRLSYFLWSGPPDDRLLELASQNRLSDPGTLATEVSRMLGDRRARRFSERFAREWLRLDKYGLVAINPEFYPHYDEDLGQDMVSEAITTFQEIFHGARDARELIASETVYVNQRLARHYGLPPVTGGKLQAVAVPDYRTRGGLLHQGAILTMTADGAESNPIYRGVWILERLLNDPPPPPPPSVPALDASSADVGPLTLKQKIELHRQQSACAACHAKIDPWGLALEHFDAIGAWREAALVINPDTAARSFSPVDSSTVLPSGEEIEGSRDLVSYLVGQRQDEFTRALTWHMMTYALARAPNLGDESELESIHRHFRTSGYKLPSLVLAIVQSESFQAVPESTARDKAVPLQTKNAPTATLIGERQ